MRQGGIDGVRFGTRTGRLRGESGAVLIFVAVGMIAFLGIAAYSLDLGRAWFTQRELQRALDASVLAAAQDLPDENAATITAHEYGPEETGKNPLQIATATTLEVEPRCVTSIEGPCEPFNALHVTGTAEVPTIFAKIFGIDTMTVKAQATACSPCVGKDKLNIMMVLDRTGSMCDGPSGPNRCRDLDLAKQGIRGFLGLMDPQVHAIGLAVLPPSLNPASDCGTPPTALPGWYTSNRFVIAPLSNDYRNGSVLNPSSVLVSKLACVQGGGYTSYSGAMNAAQVELESGVVAKSNVIIFFADGAANYPQPTPCQDGINAAQQAKDAGTLIYTIGYGLNEGNNSAQCGGGLTAEDALRQMATDETTFFEREEGGSLTQIFAAIATDIGSRFAHLIDDDAT
jgi:hypothetical protein